MPGTPERDDDALRRYAIQIAQQLPENREDAMKLLGFIRELVEWQHPVTDGQVLAFRPVG